MSIDRFTDDELKRREQELLQAIPKDGTGKGNTVLIAELGWNSDVYWEIRDRLIDDGLIERWRGRGGSVRRVGGPPQATTAPPTAEGTVPPPEVRVPEDELYGPMAVVIGSDWAKDKRYEDFHVEITARQGRRETGGKWTRPDIVLVTYSSFLFVPGKHLDITTFEVKPHDALDITAVYEALAHLRFGTRAYVLIFVPAGELAEAEDLLDSVYAEARRHGVGLVVASDPADYGQWDERVEASRHELDPNQANEFLSKQLSERAKEKLMMWSR